MTDTCGQRLPEPSAHWDPHSLCWRTSQPTLFEDSPEWSGTWPTSGMTRGGQLYALPTSAPVTGEPDSLPLLKPPTAQLATNGGSQHPDKRRAGGHGPTLADEIEHLLPTPRAQNGEDRNQAIWLRDPRQPQNLENALALLPELLAGEGMPPPSGGGSGSLGDPPLFHMT